MRVLKVGDPVVGKFLVCGVKGPKGSLKVGFKVEDIILSSLVEELIPAPFDGVFNGLLKIGDEDIPFFSLSNVLLGGSVATDFAVVVGMKDLKSRKKLGMNKLAVGVDSIFGTAEGEEEKDVDFIPGISGRVDDFYTVDLTFILENVKWNELPCERKKKISRVVEDKMELIVFPTDPPIAVDKKDIVGLLDPSENMSFLPSGKNVVGVAYFMERIIPVYGMNPSKNCGSEIIVVFKNWKALLLPVPLRKGIIKLMDYLSEDSPFKTVAVSEDGSEYFLLKPNMIDEIVVRGEISWRT
ncbi:MAG: hypothetical protein J7L28_02305 [Thermotogae bacterium]|nr:hypothetical protein [Thermotogota bacterium]